MQANLISISMLRRPRTQRFAAAGIVACLMTAALVTTASAKAASIVHDRALSMVAAQADDATIDAATGLVIVAIDPESPAAEAGIERGDILLSVDDVEVNSTAALFDAVSGAQPGDEVELFLHHGDEPRTIPVTLAQRGDRAYLGVQVVDPPGVVDAVAIPVPVPGTEAVPGSAGEATASAEIFTLPVGLIVAEVLADGPAAQAGVAAGDLILQIDGVPVTTPDELVNALKGHTPGEVATLLVQKGGPVGAAIIEVPVTLGAAPDDAQRAYLGIRFLAHDVDMTPPADYFTAPAVPVPAIPAYPEMAPGYGYPGAYSGYTCGYPPVYHYYYPPAYAAPYSAPVAPAVPVPSPIPAQPVAPPAAPFFIYHYGVNPEVYPYADAYATSYTPGETVEKDAIIYKAQAAVPGDEVQSFDVTIEPWTMPLPPTVEAVSVWVKKVIAGEQAVDVTMVPGMPVPTTVTAVPVQKDVMIWRSQDATGGDVVYAVPQVQGGTWVEQAPNVVQSEDVTAKGAAVKSFTFQVAPESGVVQMVPSDPAASSALPQVEVEKVEIPAEVNAWY